MQRGTTTQEPLGHRDVRTTMMYTHVLNRGGEGVRSPLDALKRPRRGSLSGNHIIHCYARYREPLKMTAICDIIRSWGIANPAELFFGIGVCVGLPLLATAVAFRALFTKDGVSEGRGWRFDRIGVAGCLAASGGLLAVITVPIFYPPSKVPMGFLTTMLTGTVLGASGLVILLISVLLDLGGLRRPRGETEVRWARPLIFYLPLHIIFPNLIRLYQLFDVH